LRRRSTASLLKDGEQKGRRESHRTIERRRRDHINMGIEDLARLVPGTHRSKGKTVHRTVKYINHLHDCEERLRLQRS